jgi:glutaredoxin-like protein
MISQEDQDFLREHFSKSLQADVRLTYFTQHQSTLTVPGLQCMYCKETGELLDEVAGLSDKIKVDVLDFVKDAEKAKEFGVDKIPAFVIEGPESHGLQYYGIPSGYEFSTLIEAIVIASSGDSGLSEKTREELKKVETDTTIKVFVTPT